MITLLEWEALEYHHTIKTADWYWAVGIIAATMAVISLLLSNVIFAIFIILSAIALCIHASQAPRILTYQINNRGVVVGDTLYPYNTLESFWVEMYAHTPKLFLKSKKIFMPYITIPLGTIEPEKVRAALLGYLKEEEHVEAVSLKIMEYLGF